MQILLKGASVLVRRCILPSFVEFEAIEQESCGYLLSTRHWAMHFSCIILHDLLNNPER